MLCEIRQTEKDKHCMLSLTCEIFLKVKLEEKESTMVAAKGWGMEEMLVKRYNLCYMMRKL